MKESKIDSIVFVGAGHGAIAALKSLQRVFSQLKICSEDSDVILLSRDKDVIIDSIDNLVDCTIVCAGYHKIIKAKQLRDNIFINTHPSLLPKYRGIHALVWAMLNHEKEIGFTIHLMNENIDDGDILAQFKVEYNEQLSSEIMDLFDQYVENKLGSVVYQYLNNELVPVKQDRKKASWVCRRNYDDCLIDFNISNKDLRALFRALVRPYPLPMLKLKGCRYEITEFEIIDVKYNTHIGRVVNVEGNSIFIKTKEGILVIKGLVDFETKKVISPSSLVVLGQRL